MRPRAQALAAEAIGTFALVFYGLVIMAVIYAVGHISGAHFTPPSVSRALTRRCE